MSTVATVQTDLSSEDRTKTSHKQIREATAGTAGYRSILKSTSVIGGASVLNILIGMVRTKFVAILLGPAGVGLMAMYTQIVTLITTASGLGLSLSGVRQVAEAAGTGDEERIARTVLTLRRTVWLTGILGLSAMLVFCVPISRISFGNKEHALSIALLGGTILLGAITSGQACVLRGTRRIGDLAKISVLGAISGTVISIPCFYFWGQRGIVVSLIMCAIASLAASWWFARRVPIKRIALPWRNSGEEARRLLALGLNLMAAGLTTVLSAYLIRVLLLRQLDFRGVGIFQAALFLSGVLVEFVLTAMGTDYYPRLAAVAHDNARTCRLVNEQAEISILLALPMLAAMMIFAPLVIRIFYAGSFSAAIPVLRWCLFGMLGRIVSWPLGFIPVAKEKGGLYFITSLLIAAGHVIAIQCFASLWGLVGAGFGSTVSYPFYTLLMLVLMRRLVGAAWSLRVFALVLLSTIMMAALMLSCTLIPSPIASWGISLVLLALITLFCLTQLSQRSGIGLNAVVARFASARQPTAYVSGPGGEHTIEQRPLITFALLAYNQERFIEEAVQGAFAQTYSPLEIVLSDDCSTDRTFEIMQEMARQYQGPHKIILNRNEHNLGLILHMNKVSFDLARGEIIVCAGGDDVSLAHRVDDTAAVFDGDPEVMTVSLNYQRTDEYGHIDSKQPRFEGGVFRLRDYLGGKKLPLYGCARAYRKEVFTRFGSLSASCAVEDSNLVFRALLLGKSYHLNKTGILYRRTRQSMSRVLALKHYRAILRQRIGDLQIALSVQLISPRDYESAKQVVRRSLEKHIVESRHMHSARALALCAKDILLEPVLSPRDKCSVLREVLSARLRYRLRRMRGER
jgi:PST family polysaccharide transporter